HVTWCWLAHQDGVLYCTGRTAQLAATAKLVGASNLVCAFSVKTGEVLWKYESPETVLMQSAALDGQGGLYFCTLQSADDDRTSKGAILSLDAGTGKERWRKDASIMPRNYNDCTAAGVLDGKYFIWCAADEKGKAQTRSFDIKSGELIRDYPGVRGSCESGC